jgi:hypothetical protein
MEAVRKFCNGLELCHLVLKRTVNVTINHVLSIPSKLTNTIIPTTRKCSNSMHFFKNMTTPRE